MTVPSLMPLAQKIAALLIERKETIAIAESSTGGLIAAALLAVPGASAYFVGGAVVYTKTSRAALLGIGDADMKGLRPSTEAYARLLASRMRANNSTTWALGETGATGPSGNRYGDAAGHIPVSRSSAQPNARSQWKPAAPTARRTWKPLRSGRWNCWLKRFRPEPAYSAASAISARICARNSSISIRPFGVSRCQKVQPLQASRPCATAPIRWIEPTVSPIETAPSARTMALWRFLRSTSFAPGMHQSAFDQ